MANSLIVGLIAIIILITTFLYYEILDARNFDLREQIKIIQNNI
jgi:hypothetical protein